MAAKRYTFEPVGYDLFSPTGHAPEAGTVVEDRVDTEPFATLRDAKAYAEQSIAGGWHK